MNELDVRMHNGDVFWFRNWFCLTALHFALISQDKLKLVLFSALLRISSLVWVCNNRHLRTSVRHLRIILQINSYTEPVNQLCDLAPMPPLKIIPTIAQWLISAKCNLAVPCGWKSEWLEWSIRQPNTLAGLCFLNFYFSYCLSMVGLRPSSSPSIEGTSSHFCHAGSGRVGRVWSAREKSLEILHRGWELNPGHREDRQWDRQTLSYRDWANLIAKYLWPVPKGPPPPLNQNLSPLHCNCVRAENSHTVIQSMYLQRQIILSFTTIF